MRIALEGGDRDLDVVTLRGPVQGELAGRLGPDTLLVAPRVTKAVAAVVAEAGASYVDLAGNMVLRLPPTFVHVEGKRLPTKTAGAMRAPGLRVLLAWLLDESLVGGTLHATCKVADVSVTAARDMRQRLGELGYVTGSGKGRAWTPHGRRRARHMWLEGYRMVLRPQLDLGGFHVHGADSNVTEAEGILADAWKTGHARAAATRWTWSGVNALARTPEDPGLVEAAPLLRVAVVPGVQVELELPLTPAALYNVRVLRLPIALAAEHPGLPGWPGDVPHPLMVWTELMCDANPRAHEAANALENALPPGWL
jgi:hypothetical protein